MEIYETMTDSDGGVVCQTSKDEAGEVGLIIRTVEGEEISYIMSVLTVERLVIMLNNVLESML